MQSHARVVVVGGGAVGAAILYHLVQAGVRDCLLIERDELTSGSTWHAAGNIPTYANSWLGMRAGNYSWTLYRGLAENVGSAITYRHTGAFWPAHSAERMQLFRHLSGLARSAGFDLPVVGPGEMDAIHPFWQPDQTVLGGIYDPYEGDIDPSQLTQALAKGARDGGAAVARFTRVTGIARQGSDWRVATDKGALTAEIVVNAAGFYGSEIGRMAGLPAPVAVLEHQYLVTDQLAALEAHAALFPLVRDPDIRFYLRRERNAFLFGSYGHEGRAAWPEGPPRDFAHQLFPDQVDDIAEVLERAIAHVPLLAEAGAQRFVNGPIAYAPDALPLVGPAGGARNFYHATGVQIGITHSAAIGKAIAEWITVGETEWDLAAWDPRRFGDWATPDYARARACEHYGLQYAIPFPHRIMQAGRPVRHTPIYKTLKGRGAVFGQIGGWERAFWFEREGARDTGHLSFGDNEPWRMAVRAECEAVRDRVGVMDHGGFTKYEVEGPGAADFLDRVFCGRLPAVGRVKLSYMLTPKGRIWSEATVARLDDDRILLCGPTLADQRDYDWLAAHLPLDGSVLLRRGSAYDGALMLMGPRSRAVLSALTDADLSAPWMSVAEARVAGVPAIMMRVSYVGELGWEIHLKSSDLPRVYMEIVKSNVSEGVAEFGSWALNAMRIEKGYHGWGADFGTEYSLFDAGLERFAAMDKDEFIGRAAVLEQRERTADWVFAGFEIAGAEADPLPGDPIILGDALAGYVTSASTGFRIGNRIAMGYLMREADAGADFAIDILGQRSPVRRVAMPFYDPTNARLKS